MKFTTRLHLVLHSLKYTFSFRLSLVVYIVLILSFVEWPTPQDEDEGDGDRHAKQIYNEMEKNSALMDNNPLAERLRM